MLFKAPGLREGLKLNNRIGCFLLYVLIVSTFSMFINIKSFFFNTTGYS